MEKIKNYLFGVKVKRYYWNIERIRLGKFQLNLWIVFIIYSYQKIFINYEK